MESTDEMLAFVKIIELGGFSAAARALHVPKSTLSRKLARLEERLGAQLILRTTRKVNLTEVGAAFFARCRQILAEIADAEELVRATHSQPSGPLRVTIPVISGNNRFIDALVEFAALYPSVTLDLVITNRYVDLIEEGFDVALRAGYLDSSGLMARKLGSANLVVVASPAYLARRGHPDGPGDLAQHDCLIHTRELGGQADWIGADGLPLRLRPRLRANSLEIIRKAALAGLGLAQLPNILVADDLDQGHLVPLLPALPRQDVGFYLVYPSNRYVLHRVRAFIDFVVAWAARGQLFTASPT